MQAIKEHWFYFCLIAEPEPFAAYQIFLDFFDILDDEIIEESTLRSYDFVFDIAIESWSGKLGLVIKRLSFWLESLMSGIGKTAPPF